MRIIILKTIFVRKYAVHLSSYMDHSIRKKENDRIEFRVSQEDKALFEYACSLRGFKSFSEFARTVMVKEAKAIIESEHSILISKKDKEIFFNALMGKEKEPNDALISAIKYHKDLIAP